jgi:hypothetical protein
VLEAATQVLRNNDFVGTEPSSQVTLVRQAIAAIAMSPKLTTNVCFRRIFAD